jgi:transcriptional regulator with XRE-family HTH domain
MTGRHPASVQFVAEVARTLGLSPKPGAFSELADMLGISRQTIHRWHRGQAEVRPSQVAHVAVRIGRPVVIGANADGSPLVVIFESFEE